MSLRRDRDLKSGEEKKKNEDGVTTFIPNRKKMCVVSFNKAVALVCFDNIYK